MGSTFARSLILNQSIPNGRRINQDSHAIASQDNLIQRRGSHGKRPEFTNDELLLAQVAGKVPRGEGGKGGC